MSKEKKKSFMWTKEDIKLLMKLWDGNTLEEIADRLGIRPDQVVYMSGVIRKMGYTVARKHVIGRTKAMVEDVMQELGIKKHK